MRATSNVRPVSAFESEVTVRRIRYASPETGWAVLEAIGADGSPVVLVGPLIHLEERERAHVVGTWVQDSRYGTQVKVSEARPLPPSDADADAVIAYLLRVKHVGAKRAKRLVERFGPAGVFDAIDDDPHAAFAAAGLRRGAIGEAIRSWERLRVTRKLHLLLAPHGLAYLAPRIREAYGDGAHRVVRERPYELTSVFSVGFLTADRIARSLGASDSPGRTRAAILHVLSEAERSGSTCMPLDQLLTTVNELLGSTPASEAEIDELVEAGDLVREQRWIYRAETAELEAELARRVEELIAGSASERLREPGIGRAAANPAGGGDQLTEEQLQGVRNAFSHRLSLITGGPGTGKTASIRTIGRLATGQGARVLLVAPTGRAAVRMHEASGMRATTVHSALGWVPGEGPTHDEHDPLHCDLLIVDETSMANLELLVTLLRAVGARTHVVLVGDADQLAPVGAGKPFAELIASGSVPTTRLTHIFRQAAGSMIVQAAHAIRRGEAPRFAPADGMRRDLFLIERPDAKAAREEIVSLVAERLPAHYGLDPVRDIQVFAPVYRGDLGIDALNEALRDRLNPEGQPVRGGRLRIGDKLMMTGRNLHDLGLMNGTLLRLLDEITGSSEDPTHPPPPRGEEDDDAALLLAAEDQVFRFPPEQSERLRLAYACSVHRGQGIELPVAVIVAHPAGGAFFLRREMLYTAVTRAKLATVIVGSREVIARAARTPDTGRRHSRLVDRLLRAPSDQYPSVHPVGERVG
jgi:exodeoxyribonuclease V alpha subunit